ncbi:MAG: hypothetical protein ACI9EW_004147 [Cellvibrionaceae bacterium]|jgi:hypothetical protein
MPKEETESFKKVSMQSVHNSFGFGYFLADLLGVETTSLVTTIRITSAEWMF